MRRIISVLAVAALMAAMVALSASAAFAKLVAALRFPKSNQERSRNWLRSLPIATA